MKIGIIVHSQTGNTLSVANKLKEKLISLGHTVNLEQVSAINEGTSPSKDIQLKSIPDMSEYDALIFGAPVHAFSISEIMKSYLSQIQSLNGKKACCFVTQQFPYPWMGGNHSIKQFKTSCESKNIKVMETGIVNWSSKQREKKINELIEKFSKSF